MIPHQNRSWFVYLLYIFFDILGNKLAVEDEAVTKLHCVFLKSWWSEISKLGLCWEKVVMKFSTEKFDFGSLSLDCDIHSHMYAWPKFKMIPNIFWQNFGPDRQTSPSNYEINFQEYAHEKHCKEIIVNHCCSGCNIATNTNIRAIIIIITSSLYKK